MQEVDWYRCGRRENLERAWTTARIGRFVVNTLIVMVMSLTGTLLVSALAAYVLSRYTFRGNCFIFLLFTAGLMFPMSSAWCRCTSACRMCTC